MNLTTFSKAADLASQPELEKVRLLAYYHHKTSGSTEFDRSAIQAWFAELHFSAPNLSRLVSKVRSSRSFIRGSKTGFFKLHAIDLDELQTLFPGIRGESEDVVSDDVVLPFSIIEDTRGFVESLGRQINASYDYNIFDGCAVLMRRLVEVLLILTFEHLDIEDEIKDPSGGYLPLSKIIAKAKANKKMKLTKDTKGVLDEFRELGNFSAHKIHYNCRRADLVNVLKPYRAAVEELLYKSALKS